VFEREVTMPVIACYVIARACVVRPLGIVVIIVVVKCTGDAMTTARLIIGRRIF